MTAEELRARRRALDITQQQLAQWLNVDVMTVSRWERGIRTIPPFLALALDRLDQIVALGKTVRE